MLSESLKKISSTTVSSWVLIHCISWNAFGGVASPRPYKSRVPEGVFLPDFLSTTFESTFSEGFLYNSLIFNEVAWLRFCRCFEYTAQTRGSGPQYPKYTSFSAKKHTVPAETTKKSPMRVAPGICVQEVNMKAVGLAVFGEDFEFGFAHSEVPFG